MPDDERSSDDTETSEESGSSENSEKSSESSSTDSADAADAPDSDGDSDGDTDGDSGPERSDDPELYVLDSDVDGRPVVLIHGWPMSHDSWSEQIGALRDKGYRVVAYDRRGFGQSDPGDTYVYDDLADDLDHVLSELDLTDVTLVGFSMGGGEVARYVARHGTERLRSVVFASAVPPYLQQSDDNEDGPLTKDAAAEMRSGLEDDRDGFFDEFCTNFFTAGDDLLVSDEQREAALTMCKKSDRDAALGCMDAWASTDFRDDLTKIDVPTLVIHGDSDAIVPFEGSGKRTHDAVERSELVVLEDAPHGCNVSHAKEFNNALLAFLEK